MDFFVSYTRADSAWAEWIAWQLEAEGYQVVVQAWDFGPGSDWVHAMQEAASTAERVITVLSPGYLASEHAEAEWRVFYTKDPTGELGLLLPVRVREVELPGLLGTRVYVDLVDLDAPSARKALLNAVRRVRGKPTDEPEFPGDREWLAINEPGAPRFPENSLSGYDEGGVPPESESILRANDVQAVGDFIEMASESLRLRGFSDYDIDAFKNSLRELVDNVATHVHADETVELTLSHFLRLPYREVLEGVSLKVADRGNGFDFNSALIRGEAELVERGFEHGLLRAYRLGSLLGQESMKPHVMEWIKERSPQSVPAVFGGSNVIPLVISYRQEAIRISRYIHTFTQFRQYTWRSDAFMDLIFDPLQRPARKYVGIEVTGEPWSGSVHWEEVLGPLLSFARRNARFDKQLLLFADTDPAFQRMLRDYCQNAGISMFEDEAEIRNLDEWAIRKRITPNATPMQPNVEKRWWHRK